MGWGRQFYGRGDSVYHNVNHHGAASTVLCYTVLYCTVPCSGLPSGLKHVMVHRLPVKACPSVPLGPAPLPLSTSCVAPRESRSLSYPTSLTGPALDSPPVPPGPLPPRCAVLPLPLPLLLWFLSSFASSSNFSTLGDGLMWKESQSLSSLSLFSSSNSFSSFVSEVDRSATTCSD